MSKIERVACYIRVSTQEQKLHGISLDAQIMKLTNYAKENNMKIVEWYKDEGVSGRKEIKKRPELQRMIRDAEQGKFDRIIFIKLDRFFRSVAEYHECMKRIDPVVWSTTEEKYDQTTASGRFFINAKLAVAEMEADQTGERISIGNEYKVTTGEPLTGSVPFCFEIVKDENTGKKKIIKNKNTEHIMFDLLEHFQTYQSIHKSCVYINGKYDLKLSYKSITSVLGNKMICGEYRNNRNYCEPYIDRETFDRIQEIKKRNTKSSPSKREYIFGGLIMCPNCGRRLRGIAIFNKAKNQKTYVYKKYRCQNHSLNSVCDYKKSISENVLEKLMIENVERYFEDEKIELIAIQENQSFVSPKDAIEKTNTEIDRLNYSWQTGKIKNVEQYEKHYAELEKRLEELNKQRENTVTKDYSKIEKLLTSNWKEIYRSLDDAHKRAFWRSFIECIEIDWMSEEKKIANIKFF